MSLCEKYRPESFEAVKGQKAVVEKIKAFMADFPKKKALILHGPAGTGKTSLAYAIASETNAEIIEINASDLRNKEQIQNVVGQASKQKSLFSAKKIILVDEIDGITKDDRGGLPEIEKLIEETQFPIIITANDIWDKKFFSLRRDAETLQIKELDYKTIFEIIRDIAESEGIFASSDLLINIAIKSRGDARAAINDLQTIGSGTLKENIHERDKEENIFNTIKRILKELPNKDTITLYDKVNMHLDEILLWLEENVPKEYKGEELYKAFEAISKADVFKGRIHRQQHWRFLVYENFLLSAGISAAKKQVKLGFTSYSKPSRILKIWMMNQKSLCKKSISEKYAKATHTNKKRAMRDFPIIRQILKNSSIQYELNLDEKEISFLNS